MVVHHICKLFVKSCNKQHNPNLGTMKTNACPMLESLISKDHFIQFVQRSNLGVVRHQSFEMVSTGWNTPISAIPAVAEPKTLAIPDCFCLKMIGQLVTWLFMYSKIIDKVNCGKSMLLKKINSEKNQLKKKNFVCKEKEKKRVKTGIGR